jgi:hypothetical protein
VKITKQRLQQIIKEEVQELENEGIKDFVNKLKGSDDKTPKDVETSLDYFLRLVNSPIELAEFMNLLDDAIKASTADGKLGSPEKVKSSIVNFIKQIAPKVSVTISNIDLKSGEEDEKKFRPTQPLQADFYKQQQKNKKSDPTGYVGRYDQSGPGGDPNVPRKFRGGR